MKDSDDLELQVNADEMCRTCLGQFPLNQLKPIFCNEILDGKIVPFPQVFESTMGIKPVKNEVFPKNVCVNCKSKLKELFSFKEKTSKSFDLLYEIFGIEKPLPPPSPLLAKVTTTAGTQTNEIAIREKDINLYSRFLNIERTPKPITNDSACQVEPVLEDTSCQTEPIVKLIKDASIQVDQATEAAEHLDAEIDVSHTEELLEETEIDDDNEDANYTHMDVIDDIEEVDEIEETREENIEDTEITEITEQEELNFDDKSSKSKSTCTVKLEPLSELDLENEAIEYLTYEIVNEPETESESYKASSKKATFAKKEKECTYCQFMTNLGAAFNEHIAIHQQTLESIFDRADYFRCGMCKLVYATSIGLENHLNSRTCAPIDSIDFLESNDMLKHEQFYNNGLDICLPRMKSFHMNEDSQFICSTCCVAFETLSGALDHYSFTHQQEDLNNDVNVAWEENGYNQIHACGICNEQFADASFIRQHVYFHRSRHECPFDCKESFKDFYKLTVHINRNHLAAAAATTSSSEKKDALPSDIVCQICFKRFTSKASFKVHSKNHFADRRYTCTTCPKAFLQKSDLTIHIRSHTDERPFTCTIPGCDKKFRTSSHRRDHMSTHAEEKKFQCHICQKYFKAERILQGHIRLHSGFKPFECSECGKTFSRKHHVKLHLKTHGKDMNFE